ncbi:VOC family protein [Xanthobacter sp. TB0139]|uniref:VOC family protein n=1 Tax=Xanthobacter sp. TB0139 TaxID=3459178 RepID=UPI0040394DE6
MRRGLDHVIHLVRNLDAAGEVYDLLGFTVGARNALPCGSFNRIVQTPGFFIEILQIAEEVPLPSAENGEFLPARFNAAFLEQRGEGFSMLALEGHDAEAERRLFETAGYGNAPVGRVAHTVRKVDGAEADLSCSMAFTQDPLSPDLGVMTFTQHQPENFWSEAFQRHSNHVSAVAGISLVTEVPAEHQRFLEVVTEVPVLRARDDWYVAQTPRGEIEVMTPTLFHRRYGASAPEGRGLRIAAVRFTTSGAAELRRSLEARHMVNEAVQGIIVVPPHAAMGATLIFEHRAAS